MKYFTKEELEKITERLITSPTRETLKELSDEYNKSAVGGVNTLDPISNISSNQKVVDPLPPVMEPSPATPLPNFEVNKMSAPEVNNTLNNTINVSNKIPSFELPKIENTSVNSTPNNNPINFSGNLWEPQMPEVNNLMETTDNFNNPVSPSPSTELPITGGQFFEETKNSVNNPIPISGNPSVQEPTMFGQMQSNYGNAA